jgi:hypothetical protein
MGWLRELPKKPFLKRCPMMNWGRDWPSFAVAGGLVHRSRWPSFAVAGGLVSP